MACRCGSGSFAPRHVRVDAQRGDRALQLGGERDAPAASPGEDDALAQRVAGVADAALGIDDVACAQAVARGARAVRAVEREHARLDRRQRDAAVDAREALAHPDRLVVAGLHEEAALAELERELDAVGEAALDAVLEDEAVDDDVEVVDLGPVELDLVAQVDHGAVDAGAHEAFAAQALELELQLPLARACDGRQQRQLGALGHGEHAVDDLLDGLRLDALSAVRAMRDSDTRVEQAQVVGDLGHGADRGARGLRERPLLDRDGRAQPLDALDVGLRELLEKLAGVGAQRLDVPSLALRVDRVEGERRLARSAGTGEDDDLAARQADTDVLEIVLSRAD